MGFSRALLSTDGCQRDNTRCKKFDLMKMQKTQKKLLTSSICWENNVIFIASSTHSKLHSTLHRTVHLNYIPCDSSVPCNSNAPCNLQTLHILEFEKHFIVWISINYFCFGWIWMLCLSFRKYTRAHVVTCWKGPHSAQWIEGKNILRPYEYMLRREDWC